MLADVVAVAAALDHVEQLVVAHHLAGALVQRRQDALRRERQVDARAAPGWRALPKRIEREFAGNRRRCIRLRCLRDAQDVQESLDEIGFLERRLLQVVPGVQRLHDAAVDRGRHGGHHQHRRALPPLVDRVDQRHAGIALVSQLDVQHHHVVMLAGQRRLRLVPREPLVHGHVRTRGLDPARQLVAGGQVVFDHGHFGHGANYGWGAARAV